MEPTRTRERTRTPSRTSARNNGTLYGLQPVMVKPRRKPKGPEKPVQAPGQRLRRMPRTYHEQAEHRLEEYKDDTRFQHELKEMEETDDLDDIDDDVEDVATLLEWYAEEHNHRPKSPMWYMVFAAAITVISLGFALFGNIIAAITIGFAGGLTYYMAQQEPKTMRYRLLTEGVALNNMLYHYRDLDAFNIVYEPNHTKTVLLRSNKTFAPMMHMEVGDADPVAIRDVLIEFVHEDQDMHEPLVDILARRIGF